VAPRFTQNGLFGCAIKLPSSGIRFSQQRFCRMLEWYETNAKFLHLRSHFTSNGGSPQK
jgi:hypothetical protein